MFQPCVARERNSPVSGSGRSMHTLPNSSAVWIASHTDSRMASIEKRLGQPRGHSEELLERRPVARGGGRLLRALHRDRGVIGHRHQDLELLAARQPAGLGLVDREDADQVSVGVAQRHEERVLGMPAPGLGDGLAGGHVRPGRVGLPVDLAVRDQVRAVVQEPVLQERLPDRPLARVAHQPFTGLRAAVHGRDDEVVPRRAVQVHDDGGVAERARDRPGDGREQVVELVLAADETSDLEESSQA